MCLSVCMYVSVCISLRESICVYVCRVWICVHVFVYMCYACLNALTCIFVPVRVRVMPQINALEKKERNFTPKIAFPAGLLAWLRACFQSAGERVAGCGDKQRTSFSTGRSTGGRHNLVGACWSKSPRIRNGPLASLSGSASSWRFGHPARRGAAPRRLTRRSSPK